MAEPSKSTIKRLFALSGNQCAFPECTEKIIDESGTLIGDVCHICGNRSGAKRYILNQTEEERQEFENLILLCRKHHTIIDGDEVAYSVAALKEMKSHHQARATKKFVISDRTAERIILLMVGGAAGFGFREIATRVGKLIGTISNTLASPIKRPQAKARVPEDKFFAGLLEALRYAPKGTVSYYAADEAHLGLGEFLGRLFKEAGWRDLGNILRSEAISPSGPQVMWILFELRDPNQIATAKQAVDEVFAECGFEAIDPSSGRVRTRIDGRLSVVIMFARASRQ